MADWTECFTRVPEGKSVAEYLVLLPFQREELHKIYNNRGDEGYVSPEDEVRLFESLLFERFGDKPALALALACARDELPERARQIDRKLAMGQSELRVAAFASFVCQMESLQLSPLETPPCHVGCPDTDDPREQSAAKLLWRLVHAKVSKFHPDPLGALGGRRAA